MDLLGGGVDHLHLPVDLLEGKAAKQEDRISEEVLEGAKRECLGAGW